MATSSFHRLLMEKVEISSVFFCLKRDIWTFFTEMLIEVCPVCFVRRLFESLNLIGCQGDKRVNF